MPHALQETAARGGGWFDALFCFFWRQRRELGLEENVEEEKEKEEEEKE